MSVVRANANELGAALHLLFRLLPSEERKARVSQVHRMVQKKELDPGGILVARKAGQVVGVLLCTPLAGASSLLVPPQTREVRDAILIEDALLQSGISWLRQRGAKLSQALLASPQKAEVTSLERNGFRRLTSLWHLHHNLGKLPRGHRAAKDLVFDKVRELPDQTLFQQTLLRTYEGSLDCPEVNGVRTIEEILEGHYSQGKHNPNRWWLVFRGIIPIGVLLLTELPDLGSLDVSYVGVVPEARGLGLGRVLMEKALREARAARVARLTLAVDARNRPAWNLYQKLGFEPYDQREVYLAIW